MSLMLYGFRERELILDIFEAVTGLRMNHSFIRPGGVIMDLPPDGARRIATFLDTMPARIDDYERLLNDNPIWLERNVGVGILSAEDALAFGVTGPLLRGRDVGGPPQGRAVQRLRDLRLRRPRADRGGLVRAVPGPDRGDAGVTADRRASAPAAPGVRTVMVEDPKVGWPVKLSVGPDGIGNDEAYLHHIMEESMEALIHHFKMVTQGVRVPEGEVYTTVESPGGARLLRRVRERVPAVPGEDPRPVVREPPGRAHDGGGRPDRRRDRGDRLLDPVMGGVDR